MSSTVWSAGTRAKATAAHRALKASLCLFALVAGAPAHAQTERTLPVVPEVVLYEFGDFRGNALVLREGEAIAHLRFVKRPNGSSWNDSVSSVEIRAGAKVVLFEDKDYGGRTVTVERSMRDLGDLPVEQGIPLSWNKRVSSVRVLTFEESENVASNLSPPAAVLYDQKDYKGNRFVVRQGDQLPDMYKFFRGTGRWNNAVRSLRVVNDSALILFQRNDYGGRQLMLSQSVADLGGVLIDSTPNREDWDETVSSLKVLVPQQ